MERIFQANRLAVDFVDAKYLFKKEKSLFLCHYNIRYEQQKNQ